MDIDREHYSDNDDSPMSNSTPQQSEAEEEDREVEFEKNLSPSDYLDESPPHEGTEAFSQQQLEIFERLREQFSAFPQSFPGLNLENAQMLLQQRLQQTHQEATTNPHPNDFPFPSFPTPPPSKNEEEVKVSSSSKKNLNNSWSYDDQFKQVRQLYEINDDPKRKEFLDDLFMFMKDRGTPINRLPIMAKSVLDLYELYKLVIARGGLVNVINKKLWQEIIKDLNLPSSITSAAFTLRTQYTKYLYPYESEKYNLSTDAELQAAIENNKRDGSRRSTSNNYGQFSPQSPPNQHQQLQLAMAQQLAAANVNNAALNLSLETNGKLNNPDIDLPNSQPFNQLEHQRFLMCMFMYQSFLQAQAQAMSQEGHK